MNHTPGPWIIRDHTVGYPPRRAWIEVNAPIGEGRGEHPICRIPAGFTNQEADARLIASAPDLARENRQLKEEITRLHMIIDTITGPPLTAEEAEAAMDDLPELDPAEREAMERIDIRKIIAYATDPMNMSPEEAVRRMIEAAKRADGFDPETLRLAEAWLERRWL